MKGGSSTDETSSEPKIIVNGLVKSFGNLEVLKGINAEIDKGEVICVIGPSGSGKSTFLRCLNLLEEPTAGEIVVDGLCITDKKADINKIRRHIGMVFQQFNLFPAQIGSREYHAGSGFAEDQIKGRGRAEGERASREEWA